MKRQTVGINGNVCLFPSGCQASEVSNRIYTQGCLFAIKGLITDNAWIIGGTVIGVLIPQVGLAFSVCVSVCLHVIHFI